MPLSLALSMVNREMENNPEGEVDEMVELYVKKGVPEATARRIMEILSRRKEAFVNIMMAEELGIVSDQDDASPWKNGLATFVAFLAFGIVPLVACTCARCTHSRLICPRRRDCDTAESALPLERHTHDCILRVDRYDGGHAVWHGGVEGVRHGQQLHRLCGYDLSTPHTPRQRQLTVPQLLGGGTATVGWLTTFLLNKFLHVSE